MRDARSLALLMALCSATASTATAQSYPVKSCTAPIEPLGVLHAQGQISYRLLKDGRVDTVSVQIVSVNGISAVGLRSAAIRELASCRFDRSADSTAVEVFVVSALGFDSAKTFVTPATVVPALAGIAPTHVRPAEISIVPIDATDSTVEERPRRLSCERVGNISQFTGSFRTRQDRDAAYSLWQQKNSGVMFARITVSPEGHVSPDGITVTSLSNPALRDEFIRTLSSCVYVPGRISGVAVSTIIATRTAMGNPGGP
jgi:hypothetical protein